MEFTALYPIEMRRWADAAALTPTSEAGAAADSYIYWARAIGAAHLGKVDSVRKDTEELQALREKLLAENKKDQAGAVDGDHKQATAWLEVADGNYDGALAILLPMADKEDSLGNEPQGIPAREMVAEILLLAKRPEQALAEYETDLKFNPNRFNGLYGAAQAAEAAGKQEKASQYYADLVKVCAGSTSERPELTHAKELVAQK